MPFPVHSISPPGSTTNVMASSGTSSLRAKLRAPRIAGGEGLTALPVPLLTVARLQGHEQLPQQRVDRLPIARGQGREHSFVTGVVGFDRFVNQPLAGSCERDVDCPPVLWMGRSSDEAAFLELIKLRGHTR